MFGIQGELMKLLAASGAVARTELGPCKAYIPKLNGKDCFTYLCGTEAGVPDDLRKLEARMCGPCFCDHLLRLVTAHTLRVLVVAQINSNRGEVK